VKFEKKFSRELSSDDLSSVATLLQEKWFAANPLKINWLENGTVSFVGKGFTGNLGFDLNTLWLELKLSLLLAPLQRKIRQTIEREFANLVF
jgi:hypothetical protein